MYSEIKEQFKSVIRYSQGIQDPMVESIFHNWERAKEKFIKRFGGLIYEWPEPIEFMLDEGTKRLLAMDFANTVSDTFNNPVLAEFIDENVDTFFENKVSKSLGQKIPEGMKLLKAFKFFEEDKATLRNIQDMASQIIQENKVKGTLCFSVHPLDFLSSSENTYNWRSCHALDGEYRAGNLSYMLDTSTFMVYLKGADNQHLYGFGGVPWNSKKWRVLLHASDDDEIMFAGRQYPFTSKAGLDTVLNIYNNLVIAESLDSPWSRMRNKYGNWKSDYIEGYVPSGCPADADPIMLSDKYIVYDNRLMSLNEVVKEGPNALNYNDVLKSTCYTYPYYTTLSPWSSHSVEYRRVHPIVVGEEVPCLHCGDEVILNAETMRCDDCELKYGTEENDCYSSCDCCGARIYVDDAICVGDDGDLICDACYDTQCFVCDNCGEVHYNSDKVFVPIGKDGEEEVWYCHACYEDYKDSKERY